jgi:hypothetical protein
MKRLLMFSMAALVGFAICADAALAKRVTIGGTHSRAELKAKCAAAQGGIFLNEKGGGYSCYATGSVTCDAKGKCTGKVPRRQTTNGGRTGVIGGTTKAMSLGATRIGGTQRTHGSPPTSAAMIQRCWKHHC